MALIDLTSDLTWYGTPPAYDGAQNPQGISGTNEHQAGFTPGRKHLDETEFTGISGGQFNRPNVFSTVLGFTDYFVNDDQLGFTPNRQPLDPTEFKGVTGGPGALEFNRPSILNTVLGNVDNLHNTAAKGFTPDLIHRSPSQFQGITISDWTYDYPATILSSYGFYNERMPDKKLGSTVNTKFSPKYVPEGNVVGFQADGSRFSFNKDTLRPFTKVPIGRSLDVSYQDREAKNKFWIDDKTYNVNGDASFLNQGGQGYPFPSFDGTQYDWKPLKHTGWNPNSRYGDVVGINSKTKPNTNFGLADTYTTNSPIDDMYNKFVVRDEAFNPVGYAREPFILRGIQRPGKTENQRWGFGVSGPWADDGLMRAGVVASVDRLAMDVLRIGKWLIKPKGILWMVKQFGLQQSNPTYESFSGTPGMPLAQMNKIWTPINTLANVATNALGLHWQRHGILPGPTVGRYEAIFKFRDSLLNLDGKAANRLYKTGERKGAGIFTNFAVALTKKIPNLGNVNGPNTLYGIPGTSTLTGNPIIGISRAVDSRGKWTNDYMALNGYPRQQNQYASLLSPSISTNLSPTGRLKAADKRKLKAHFRPPQLPNVGFEHQSFFGKPPLLKANEKDKNVPPTEINGYSQPATPTDPDPLKKLPNIQKYATVSYGKLPTKEKAITPSSFHDFRSLIDKSDSVKFMGSSKAAAYAEKNIQTKYGIPDSGKVGVDRSDFTKSTGLSDPINMLSKGNDYGEDKKDFIKFKFQVHQTPIIFRAFIQNIGDSINPTWSAEQEQGDTSPIYGIETLTREISITFIVAATTKEELKILWEKTDRLSQIMLPMGASDFTAQKMMVTIGNLIVNRRGWISGFSVDIDPETPWDIDAELPMYWTIDLSIILDLRSAYVSNSTSTIYTGLSNVT